MGKITEKLNKVIGIIALLGAAAMILTTVVAASYSVIVSDDFWFAADTGRRDNFFLYIVASFQRMVHEYITWQGSYFSEFINPIFNPVNVGGPVMFRVVMVVHALFVYASIVFFVHVLVGKALGEKSWLECVILACIIFTVAEYETFPEIFFWYTGATVNSLPLSIGLFALAMVINISDQEKVGKELVAAYVLGFLSAGGSLAVSGTLCYSALMIVLYFVIKDHWIPRCALTLFISMFVGSVINAAAPGNFARQQVEQSGEGLSVVGGIINTMDAFTGEMEWLFTQTNYVAVLLILVVCGIFMSGKLQLNRKAWYISGAFALLTPVVTIFPVVLGYGAPWIPNRCEFIFVVALAICFGNFALIVGDFVGDMLAEKKTYAAIIVTVFALVLVAISNFSPWSYRSVRLAKGIADGIYKDSWVKTNEFLDSLSGHEGEAVEADIATYPESIEYYYSFFLPDSTDDRINMAVAWAYGLESIRSTRKAGE